MSSLTNKWCLTLVGLAATAGPAGLVIGDQPENPQITRSRVEQTSYINTPLSSLDRARAEVWGLTETEWRRYRHLMEGIRGSVSPPTISPIEVLGIHARDANERWRYAEVWTRMMREDVERILAFQHAYDEAGRRLYPDTPLIDVSRLRAEEAQTPDLTPSDRVLFFTRPSCPRCDAVLDRLLHRLDRIAGIDIYLSHVSPGDEEAVRVWAAEQEIRPEWVANRRVTLNFDAGALNQLIPGEVRLPTLMRRRGTDIEPLKVSALR